MSVRSARSGRVLLSVLGALTAVLIATPPSAQAASPSPSPSIGSDGASADAPARVTFGISPATEKGPDGRTAFTYQTSPGGAYSDYFAIQNYADEPVKLGLSVQDLVNTSSGGLGVAADTTTTYGAADWLSLDGGRERITVPARTATGPGRVVLPLQMTVPTDAIPGDHTAAIVAALTTLGKNPQGENVKLVQQIATRVYVRVNGELKPALTVTNVGPSYDGSANPIAKGTATVTYRISNTGNVAVGAHPSVTVDGLFGTSASASSDDLPLLLPGSSVDLSTTVEGVLPTFRETATVRVVPLSVGSGPEPQGDAVHAEASFWAVPWTALLIILLLFLAGAAWWWRRRRRPSSPEPTSDSTGEESSDGGKKSAVAAGTAVSLLAILVLGWGSPARAADSVPFDDYAVKGYIGFCDRDGQPVTSGSIHDRPFVWRAVSSVAAPAEYSGNGQKATLLAYQPRPDAYPTQFSGDTLTATSTYTNAAHPMAAATDLDFTLADFLAEYPAKLDGLVQVRMYLGKPGMPVLTTQYPATVIRVTGDRWTVVSAGSVSCAAGKAVSSETTTDAVKTQPSGAPTGPAKQSSPVATSAPTTESPSGSTSPTGGGTPPASSASVSSLAPAPSHSDSAVVADDGSSWGSGSGSAWPFALGMVVLAAVGGGIAAFVRSRSRSA